jgi:glycosyltransferase involved in cell wall biosynthesis
MSQELVRRAMKSTVPDSQGERPSGAVCHVLSETLDLPRLRTHDMDVWHVMNSGYSPLAVFRKNVVVHVHGNDFLKPWIGIDGPLIWRFRAPVNSLTMLYGFRKSFRILSNSRFTRSLLLKKFGRRASLEPKTDVFNLGISEDYFLPRTNLGHPSGKKERIEFVTVSRLVNSRKNVDSVILAMDALKREGEFDVHYTVIATARIVPGWPTRETAGSKTRSRFGVYPQRGGTERLGRSDLFILAPLSEPNDVEGFGIVYIEANACGVPALASKNSGAEDAVRERRQRIFRETPRPTGSRTPFIDSSQGIRFDREQVMEHAEYFRWPRFVDRLEDRIYREIGADKPHGHPWAAIGLLMYIYLDIRSSSS